MDCSSSRRRVLDLPRRELLPHHVLTLFLRQLVPPDKPYRSSNLGSFRMKA